MLKEEKSFVCHKCGAFYKNQVSLRRHNAKEHPRNHIDDGELCFYGCGQEAKYLSKLGVACCSEYFSSCPVIIEKKKEKREQHRKEIETDQTCYLCNGKAKHLIGSNYCCSSNISSCPEIIRRRGETFAKNNTKFNGFYKCTQCANTYDTDTGLHHHMKTKHHRDHLDDGELCFYGCGQPAIVLHKNGLGTCSKSSFGCSAILEKRNQNNIAKHGVPYAVQFADFETKKAATNLERYGNIYGVAENTAEHRKQTTLDRYGVENVMYLQEYKSKNIQTNIERYGVANVMQSPEIQKRLEVSNIMKHGYKMPFHSEEIQKKCRETSLRKYGHPYLFAKPKPYAFPSGKEVIVYGYEPIVIDDLLKSGLSEEDIEVENPPIIPYRFDGKTRKYYSDIFLPRYNLIIEVKSNFTFRIYKEVNLIKRQACLDAGYSFRFVIRR